MEKKPVSEIQNNPENFSERKLLGLEPRSESVVYSGQTFDFTPLQKQIIENRNNLPWLVRLLEKYGLKFEYYDPIICPNGIINKTDKIGNRKNLLTTERGKESFLFAVLLELSDMHAEYYREIIPTYNNIKKIFFSEFAYKKIKELEEKRERFFLVNRNEDKEIEKILKILENKGLSPLEIFRSEYIPKYYPNLDRNILKGNEVQKRSLLTYLKDLEFALRSDGKENIQDLVTARRNKSEISRSLRNSERKIYSEKAEKMIYIAQGWKK